MIVWHIVMIKNHKEYYLADFDTVGNIALWSANKSDALAFKSEEKMIEFVDIYFGHRKDFNFLEAYAKQV